MAKEFKDFETALKRLEEIVGKLEQGEIPLERALELFEEGVKISRYCGGKLEEAERKVEILVKSQRNKMEAQSFEPSEGDLSE